ncbi:cation diffusion facilitator family transporter [Pseudobutyrivibrio sp.]|uniref:cation diffusion facilitator family transporter n=1 Tax=Pseudobutyrivibrio sp. TaxID=2014367 RepID=UPI0025EE6CC7|nr:cation diffusion facilitator family transporter [Pseudobutyrivibrio sp.]MBR5649284.1 cation transporter [Pseudobutyrivibrio sp.]
MDRNKKIIQTSIIGIAANCLLAAFKAFIGLLSGSIAIVLDAVNNLSDALSSVITIVGTKLANKAPDRKHPLGHGRVEYISTAVIAIIICYAGITSLVESIKKIIDPQLPKYTTVTLLIVAVAVFVKIILGTYVKKVGESVKSESLVASGEDAKLDAVISTSTLVAAIIFIQFGVSLEAYLGAIISIVIIKAGYDMISETISHILGERVEIELSHQVKRIVVSFDEVSGAYDLSLHNYGPDRYVGSIHIEVDEDMTMTRLDQLQRQIAYVVFKETGVALEGIGIYSKNKKDSEADMLQKEIARYVKTFDYVKQIHGFYYDPAQKLMSFDVVITFDSPDRDATYHQIVAALKEKYPDYTFSVNMDVDLSD